jgi:hypothetical protein
MSDLTLSGKGHSLPPPAVTIYRIHITHPSPISLPRTALTETSVIQYTFLSDIDI